MSGIITWYNPMTSPNGREFIGTLMTTTLIIGQKYYMSFFINYSGYIYGWRQVASNNIGLRFSTVPSNSINIASINNFSHLKTVTVYNDTVNWLKVSGSFIADSSYQYLSIGNFYDDNNTDTSSYAGNVFGGMAAYYYVDDICVSTDSNYTQIWTSVIENKNLDFNIFPNPCSEKLNFIGNNDVEKIIIYNRIGQPIFQEKPLKSNGSIDVSKIANGIYYILFYYKDYIESKKIIIKNL